jgi:hypothetical protein
METDRNGAVRATIRRMATFPADVLDRLRETREIEIETTRKSGDKRRTIIWIVVDGDDVFVRSEYGDSGWWYRDITARPEARVTPRKGDQTPIDVRAIHVTDPESTERCSAAIRTKYGSSSATGIMTRSPALESTIRLEPA